MGSIPLSLQWAPTIQLLLQTHKPIVCTAHSDFDLHRDLRQLDKLSSQADEEGLLLGDSIEMIIPPHRNPFATQKLTIDDNEEVEEAKIVTTNHSIYAFSAK